MSVSDHPDYEKEISRLSYTLSYLTKHNEIIMQNKNKIDKWVDYSVTHYNSDNAEQYNELLINTNIQNSLSQKLKDFYKSLVKPYFARVDFAENGNNKLHKLYIGKISLIRDEDQEPIIIDWRAPIATLYYEGRLGDASYKSPDGEICGQIKLKRQFTIEKAKLKEIYDIDITTNDEFLQAALGSSKDKRLKDIVSTIQAEQNKVIRADMWKSLVVQGAAGGGKTTIALHRIAYLLYNYADSVTAKNFMIIAPNRFFLSYISEVLPDLGVENVFQTTFEDFALSIINQNIKIKYSYEKLSYLLNNLNSEYKNAVIKSISSFKSSLNFKNLMNDYIKTLEFNFIPQEDFKIDSFTLVKYEDIKELFCQEYKNLPLMHRVNEIKKTLINTLNSNKKPILKEIQTKYDNKIEDARESMVDSTERRKIIIELTDSRDALLVKTKKKFKTAVKDYLSKITLLSPLEYYKKLFNDEKLFLKLTGAYLDKEMAPQVRLETLNNLYDNEVEVEDLAPLMYIKYMTSGISEKLEVRHVVIDEAQDFSPFQLYILKRIIGGNSFTILGDLCQGIYSYRGINDWESVSDNIFGKDNYTMLTLYESYRTTIEIMDAANHVIKFLNDENLPPSKPVLRHGEKVKVVEKANSKEIGDEIAAKISLISKEGFKSAAIICKTMEECKQMNTCLKAHNLNIEIITGNENEYNGGIVIIPSYLVKGLEFDVVIIANGSSRSYTTDPLDVKLLYVAMTRPLHKLYIYSVGKKAAMLNWGDNCD